MTTIETWRQGIEITLRHFHLDLGEWYLFEDDDGGRLIWCHPDERQAFVDAGIPEEGLVS